MNLAYSLQLSHCDANEAADLDNRKVTGLTKCIQDTERCLFSDGLLKCIFLSLIASANSKEIRARSQRRSHILWIKESFMAELYCCTWSYKMYSASVEKFLQFS